MHDPGLSQGALAMRMTHRVVRCQRAFSLIEMVVTLSVAATLVALLGVVVARALQSSRESQTQQQVRQVYTAIFGEPSRGSHGYVGDMGQLPTALSDLVTVGSQMAFHAQDGATAHKGNVGTGWRGPYLTSPFSSTDLMTDAWGQQLSYTAGQVISNGPDGALSTSDDIKFPVQLPVNTTGQLVVTVTVNDIPQPSGLTVSVYTTSNGEQVLKAAQTTAAAGAVPFPFTVPHGPSAIVATHTAGNITVTRTVTVQVAAGSQVATTITMRTSATVSM